MAKTSLTTMDQDALDLACGLSVVVNLSVQWLDVEFGVEVHTSDNSGLKNVSIQDTGTAVTTKKLRGADAARQLRKDGNYEKK